jgi:hypothetical protein
MTTDASTPRREVVLGRSSTVWQRLSAEPQLASRVGAAIGHHDLASFEFSPGDRVWVLSYSRDPRENSAMLQRLHAAGVREIVYVSSASTIVAQRTRCYEYPRVKLQAEQEALALPEAKLLTIGLMHDSVDELPAGTNIATRHAELAAFMLQPDWPDGGGRGKRLFHVEQRPFGSAFERAACGLYSSLLMAAGSRPCLLRPLDLILRLLGWRWYGYTCLSNRLWTSKTS